MLRDGAPILNIDHHHDNTRFGTHQPRRAGRVVHGRDRVGPDARRSACAPTPAIAEALYVGLVTDTGRFMYENTGPRAHEMAAELIAAGVDVHAIYRRLYEGMPEPQARRCWRARSTHVERFDGGRLTLRDARARDDFARDRRRGELLRGRSSTTCGPSRARRSRRSPASQRSTAAGARKVSLRATDGEVDVSRDRPRGRRRRAPPRGRLHHDLEPDELVAFLRAQIAAQLAPTAR